jgi:para-nitrobenzyl esterase
MPVETSRRSVLAATLVSAAATLPLRAGAQDAPKNAPFLIAPRQPVLDIASGKIRGYAQDGINIFKGIPYGAPASGENRFQPPRPAEPWAGVRDTLNFGWECPYFATPVKDVGTPEKPEDNFLLYRNWFPHNSSEDCLRVNVWAPATSGKKPVLVYMHGGGYIAGSGHGLLSYDGLNLAKHDAVVVTHNHRLNMFGYMDLSPFGGRWANSVNLGLQDIVLLLKWVKQNIAAFGGDPGNVTIFGQSGGGGKVLSLLAMPSAQGLFHKAIVQSGAFPGMNNITPEEAKAQTDKALSALGIAGDPGKLKDKTVEELCTVARSLPLPKWCPVVDGKLLPHKPGEALPRNIPLLIGTNLNETVNAVDNPERETFDEATLISEARRLYGNAGPAIAAAYRNALVERTPFEIWCAMQAHGIRGATIAIADAKFARDRQVWQYIFAWNTPVLEGRPKTFHSAEIAFVFDNAALCCNQTGGGPEALKLARQISEAWIAFARKGNPNHPGLPTWPAYAPDHPVMLFDTPCNVVPNPEGQGPNLIAQLKPEKGA